MALGELPTPPSPTLYELPTSKTHDEYASSSLAYDLIRYTPAPTVILDASLSVRHVSDSYVTVSGANNREELVGQRVDDIFDPRNTLTAFTSAREAIRAARDTGTLQQEKVVTDTGTAWNLRAVPILSHESLRCIQMEFLDITEEHRRELELKERSYQNETFRILVETVRDYAIFMLDPTGRIATWNAGAQGFKGYTPAEIIGKHFSTFYSQEDRDDDKPGRELRDALRDGRCEDEGWRFRKDGSRFWANVVITPVYKDNVLLGFSKVTRDLTERRKAEKSMIAAYEEASKLKSEFLANMSHEIRTPMHGMLSALTLLRDTKLDNNQSELTQVIQESGDVLLQVLNDILDFSKLESGSFSISQLDIVNVGDIIQSVFRAQQRCHRAEVNLEVFLDPQLPRSAEGDSLRYRQIVQNLLSNATKFTDNGYIRIVARLEKEDMDSFTILTEVVDTGIGVPANGARTLFTPFSQCDNSATKRYKGTGLGLSICKSLAELMGGNIGFHPNPEGRGSVFWFTAKLKKCNKLQAIEVLEGSMASLKIPSPISDPMDTLKLIAADKRLLLAEDNRINQIVMLKMLAGLGFEKVDTAMNGEEAVTQAMQDPPPYDLILMDVNMPIKDGVTATKELREKGLQAPIIAMTANALKGQAESYIAKGMTGYIAKPVDRRLLVNLLVDCLESEG